MSKSAKVVLARVLIRQMSSILDLPNWPPFQICDPLLTGLNRHRNCHVFEPRPDFGANVQAYFGWSVSFPGRGHRYETRLLFVIKQTVKRDERRPEGRGEAAIASSVRLRVSRRS